MTRNPLSRGNDSDSQFLSPFTARIYRKAARFGLHRRKCRNRCWTGMRSEGMCRTLHR